MFRRLVLLGLLATVLLSPVVVFAVDSDESLENSPVSLIATGSMCDEGTLGTFASGDVVSLEPVWEAAKYSCGAGYYLNADVVRRENNGCTACPENKYCPGFSGIDFTESDYGKDECPSGYPNARAKSEGESDCYKIEAVPCGKVNPYPVENGIAEYANAEAECKKYFGSESDCDVVLDNTVCTVTGAICNVGQARLVDGEWRCATTPKTKITCAAGMYLPKESDECVVCPKDSYCEGSDVNGEYDLFADADQGIVECPDNLKSPQGMHSENDCGLILRINGDPLYLRRYETRGDKRGPRLVVEIRGQKWYADMSPTTMDDVKAISTESGKRLHVMIKGQDYTVHSVYYEEE